MLLGYEAHDGSAVVTQVIGPGPRARQKRFGFVPDGEYQQEKLEEHFFATEGRETYLGDWHTHPASDSAPSLVDRRTLARIALEPAARAPRPLMVILSGETGNWTVGAVRLVEARRRFFWIGCKLDRLVTTFFRPNNA
jgi:integrative and conjugative element protein (TIGR02256 family)